MSSSTPTSLRVVADLPRLFVAVWPPEEVVEELMALPRKDQRGVRFTPPDKWHITLRFLNRADPDEVTAAIDEAGLEPATARLGPGVDVLDERVLIVPVHGLAPLAAAVAGPTRHLGEPPRKRFVGHLTLARLKPNLQPPRALGMVVSAEFDVDEISLVQSRLHPDGARYQELKTWPVPGN
jgi:RNA 2',3'-cyclic 3'-phosphodiesterase